MTNQNLQNLDNPTPTRWQKSNPLEGDVAQTLEDVKNRLDPMFAKMTDILELLKGVLNVTVNLLIDFTDPNKLIVKAAIEAVRAVLEDFEGSAGCYFIGIPIIPIDKELSNQILYPKHPGGGLVSITEPLAIATKENRIGSGGNYGFLSTVAESLSDPNDPLRPTFDENAHVAALTFYFGAESYLKVAALINKLTNLFGGTKKTGLSEAIKGVSDFPKPKNLRAEIAASSKTSALYETQRNYFAPDGFQSPYAVRLNWDLENETHVLPWPNNKGTANETWKITDVMVFRSDKPISTSTSLKALEKLKIHEYEFSGWVSEFFDDGVELGKTWYYAVGYKMAEVLEEAGGGFSEVLSDEPQPFNITTTQIVLPRDIDIFSRRGTPPDWGVIANPLACIPAVTTTIRRIHAILDDIEKTLDDKYDKMKKYLRALEALIESHIDYVQEIVDTVDTLIDSLNWTGVYAGVTAFAGKGGNSFFLNSLGTALNDEADPNRPPFDKGTEAVCGFILYAGAQSYGGIEKFIALSEFLWGTSFGRGEGTWEDSESAWDKAKESIDVAIDDVERQLCLAEDLGRLIDCPEEPELKKAFNEQMEPADEAEGCKT